MHVWLVLDYPARQPIFEDEGTLFEDEGPSSLSSLSAYMSIFAVVFSLCVHVYSLFFFTRVFLNRVPRIQIIEGK